MKKATLCFIFRDNPHRQILLGYKKRGFGVGKYDGFGGKLQQDEDISMAALRELREESGITARLTDLIPLGILTFIFPYRPEWSQEVHVFTVKEWHGTPTESEEMRPVWYSIAELPYHQMWDDSHLWLPYILSNQAIRATFTINKDNETVQDYTIKLL